ncbi:unnamed protein product, partial [Mesorhabditis belari]|uniref:ornithine decarboxylase n=1 Tax=Mesorhabditis belari TaxID=2138241 RepID=A0AAF3EVY3_9BILA
MIPKTTNSRHVLFGNEKVEVFDQSLTDEEIALLIAERYDKLGFDDPFMVMNLDEVLEKFHQWKRELPMVEPFYAVKCFPNRVLTRFLAKLGVGYDCASKTEINDILDLDVSAEKIIYAHPCKPINHIKFASENGVQMMTFDTVEELEKVKKFHSKPQLILRIAVADPSALCQLNTKFGVNPVKQAPQLIKKAKEIGLNIDGISFHIGSGANDFTTHEIAIAHSRNLFDYARSLGHHMHILDIGGGFPGGEHKFSFEQIASIIRSSLEKYFYDDSVRIIAEPGRFFCARPCFECVNVIHAAQAPREGDDSNHIVYYINDGIFGSFNCKLYDFVHPKGKPLKLDSQAQLFPSTIWGPTCDGGDKIEENVSLPKMSTGDWLLYQEMGAYTIAGGSTFNGFPRPKMHYTISNENYAKYLA